MSGLPTNQIDHYMTEEELTAEFGKNGWKQFPEPSHADIGSFRPKSKWMNRTSYWRVCQQIRRTYGKGGSSKEPALWKSGICVTDGYQVYHTLEKEREDLTIAGCWVHARRRFDGALTLVPKEGQKESASYLILKQIQAIYRKEGKCKRPAL